MDSALSNANNITHVYYFIIIPIGIIAYAAYMFFRLKGDRRRKQDWLEAHPDAAKVYIGKNNSIIKKLMHRIQIISVDGEKPIFFTEKMINGFLSRRERMSSNRHFQKRAPAFSTEALQRPIGRANRKSPHKRGSHTITRSTLKANPTASKNSAFKTNTGRTARRPVKARPHPKPPVSFFAKNRVSINN